MKSSYRVEQFLLIGAVALIFLMWLANTSTDWNQASKNPSSASDGASGVSVFYDLLNSTSSSSATSVRRAFFQSKDLANFQTLYLLSPKRPLSSNEQELVLDWVKKGGKLVLSFQDEATQKALKVFLDRADMNAFVGPVPGFRQGQDVTAEVKQSHSFFVSGDVHHFYSTLRFQDHACFMEPVDCYVREGIYGKGAVVAIAGLVPFSNALIARGENAKLAARIASISGRVAFADYHLLVSEKSMKDFLFDPAVVLPMSGLLIGVLLFFFAGGGDFDRQQVRSARAVRRRSFHALNRQLLQTVLTTPGSLGAAGSKQYYFIKRLLGSSMTDAERRSLERIATPLETKGLTDREAVTTIYRLIEFHQGWLKSRRRNRSNE